MSSVDALRKLKLKLGALGVGPLYWNGLKCT